MHDPDAQAGVFFVTKLMTCRVLSTNTTYRNQVHSCKRTYMDADTHYTQSYDHARIYTHTRLQTFTYTRAHSSIHAYIRTYTYIHAYIYT